MASKVSNETVVDLQNKIRLMAKDLKQYTDESQKRVKKQQAQISKLKEDNAALRRDLATRQAPSEIRPPSRPGTALEPVDNYREKIELEKQNLKKVEADIQAIQKSIVEQRKSMGGINASKDTSNALNKQLQILENRLDKANQKFNEAIAHNKQLREEIDNLRRERVIFDQIYQKLEEELQNKRKSMAEIIETANSAYEKRDRAQDELGALKQRAEREQVEFEKLWRELNASMENHKKLEEEMKLREREKEQSLHQREQVRQEEEAKKRKKDPQGQSIDDLKNFEEAFNKIQVTTGISDIDELVEAFIKAEDKNFTLFKFVNELSNEIETLERVIGQLELEIANYNTDEEGPTLQKTKLELEEKLKKYLRKVGDYEKRYQDTLNTLQDIKQEITTTFTTLECDSYLTKEFLEESISESNMVQYLTLIEQRSSEIYQAYSLMLARNNRKDFVSSSNPAAAEPKRARYDLPSISDDLQANEKELLSLQDFKELAARALEKGDLDMSEMPKLDKIRGKIK